MNIGFSTGSIAKSNFQNAIDALRRTSANVIELSALRESELEGLIAALDELNLEHFDYVSFHAPGKLRLHDENWLIGNLLEVKERGYNIVLHPDVIVEIRNWRRLSDCLCIENMDKRKPIGRTSKDLAVIFEHLPDARFCLDLAHVRQVDPTMTEAATMIRKFGHRLSQIHLSDVNSQSIHEPLNVESILSYHKVAHLIDCNIPVVLESPVPIERIETEMKLASLVFNKVDFAQWMASVGLKYHLPSGHYYICEV